MRDDRRDDLYWTDAAGNRRAKPPVVVWHEAHLRAVEQRRRERKQGFYFALAVLLVLAVVLALHG